MAAKDKDRPRVRVYPTGNAYLPGVAPVERIVPAEMADVLTGGTRPAFTTQRPEGQDAPSDDVREDTEDIEREIEQFRPAAAEAPATISSPGGVPVTSLPTVEPEPLTQSVVSTAPNAKEDQTDG